MSQVFMFVISWGLILLQTWVVLCASTWFWAGLGITYPIALAALIVIRMVFNTLNAISNLHAGHYLGSVDVFTHEINGKKIIKLWSHEVTMGYISTLFGWLFLWILHSVV